MVEYRLAKARVAGSNPVSRFPDKEASKNYILCASGSVVEYRLAKARVAGSNPVSRFMKRKLESFLFLMSMEIYRA